MTQAEQIIAIRRLFQDARRMKRSGIWLSVEEVEALLMIGRALPLSQPEPGEISEGVPQPAKPGPRDGSTEEKI
jgi:hypothetical protein